MTHSVSIVIGLCKGVFILFKKGKKIKVQLKKSLEIDLVWLNTQPLKFLNASVAFNSYAPGSGFTLREATV